MKKKKIKKLAKEIFEVGKKLERKRFTKSISPMEDVAGMNDLNYCEYDERVSEKFSKFVLNLIKIKDKIIINLYKDGFDIFCDINKFKNSNKTYTENTLDIKIDKLGFKIRRTYGNWTGYKDMDIFNNLKQEVIEKNEIVSKEHLFETINDLMVELNLSRENNLEEILK